MGAMQSSKLLGLGPAPAPSAAGNSASDVPYWWPATSLSAEEPAAGGSPSAGSPAPTGPVKVIHFVWLQGADNLREQHPTLDAYVRTWRQFFPHWEHKIWSDADVKRLLKESFPPCVAAAYDAAPSFAVKSDIARYAIVFHEGGMYVDTDMECLRPFEYMLLPSKPSATVGSRPLNIEAQLMPPTNNCWFYMPSAGAPELGALLDHICTAMAATPPGRRKGMRWVFDTTGPVAFRNALLNTRGPDAVNWLSADVVDPVNAHNLHLDVSGDTARERFPAAVSVHHVQFSWGGKHRGLIMWIGRAWGFTRQNMLILFIVLVVVVTVLSVALTAMVFTKCRSGGGRRRHQLPLSNARL
jgi:hypothetical protein